MNLKGNCWKGQCNDCKDGNFLHVDTESDRLCVWKCWEKVEDKMTLVPKSGCIEELVDLLNTNFNAFRDHVRTKRLQNAAFKKAKENEHSSVLQVDFVMSYTCEFQDEVQGMLLVRQNVNLFTAAFHHGNKPCKSYLIATDSQNKYEEFEENSIHCPF